MLEKSSLLLLFLFVIPIHAQSCSDTNNDGTCETFVTSTEATDNLFYGIQAGDLHLVKDAIQAGADVEEMRIVEGINQSPYSIAHSQTSNFYESRNVYDDISELINLAIEEKSQRKLKKEKENQQKHLELALKSSAIDLLFYSVETPPQCNFSLAEEAFRKDPRNIIAKNAIELQNIREAAYDKSGANSVLDWSPNDCSKILRMIDEKINAYNQEEVSKQLEERLKIQRLEDEEKYPSIKLMRETFSSFIGIEPLLDEFAKIFKSKDNELRWNPNPRCENEVWLITGAPGTGKTSISRLLTPVLQAAKFISKNKFKEVKKSELKGTYVGQANDLAEKLFLEYNGGVLFIDEAYSYSQDDQYEKQVMDYFLQSVTFPTTCEDKKILLLAGYPEEMNKWIEFNQGFKRRITKTFYIPTPTPKTLATITVNKLNNDKKHFIDADPELFLPALTTMITTAVTESIRIDQGASVATHLANSIFEKHSQTSRTNIVSQETVCRAIKELPKILKVDASSDSDFNVECIIVDTNQNIANITAAAAAAAAAKKSEKRASSESRKSGERFSTSNVTPSTVTPESSGKAKKNRMKKKEKTTQETQGILNFLQNLINKFTFLYATLPWLLQIVVYGAAIALFGTTIGSVVIFILKASWHFLKCMWWLMKQMLHLFKQLWNTLIDCCCHTKKGYKFEKSDDPDASAFERARNCIKRESGSVDKAMVILWEMAPREAALHGSDLKANLTLLREIHFPEEHVTPKVVTSTSTIGNNTSNSEKYIEKSQQQSGHKLHTETKSNYATNK